MGKNFDEDVWTLVGFCQSFIVLGVVTILCRLECNPATILMVKNGLWVRWLNRIRTLGFISSTVATALISYLFLSLLRGGSKWRKELSQLQSGFLDQWILQKLRFSDNDLNSNIPFYESLALYYWKSISWLMAFTTDFKWFPAKIRHSISYSSTGFIYNLGTEPY